MSEERTPMEPQPDSETESRPSASITTTDATPDAASAAEVASTPEAPSAAEVASTPEAPPAAEVVSTPDATPTAAVASAPGTGSTPGDAVTATPPAVGANIAPATPPTPDTSPPRAAKPMPVAARMTARTPAAPPKTETATDLEEDPVKAEAKRAEFAKMLDQYGHPEQGTTPPVGSRVQGRIVLIGEETSFVDFGGRSEGVVETRLLRKDDGELEYKIGDSIDLMVIADGDQLILGTAVQVAASDALQMVRDARQQGLPVSGKVIALNAGGLEVQVSGLRAFCPFSQVEIGYCAEPSALIGKTFEFQVEQIDQKGKSTNLVLSRKALLLRAEAQATEELLSTLKEGADLEGTVTRLQPFGAFVDLGGVEGLVHVSEIQHSRTENPDDVLKQGQRVKVRVLGIEHKGKRPRISLSIKAAAPNPWDEIAEQYWEGKKTTGTVMRLTNFGAFVELTPGIEGLVHISEIAHRPIGDPSEALSAGQQVELTVLRVEPERRRIALSIRDRLEAPAKSASADSPAERRPRIGDVVDAVVRTIKPYGIFADLPIYGPRVSGLIPHEETGENRSTDLSKRFEQGAPLKVTVIDVAGDGKIRLSMTAQQVLEEKRGVEDFRAQTASSRGNSTAIEEAFKKAMQSNR